MINKTINELHRIFDLLNKSFFENKLEDVVIIIEGRTKKTMGHFTTQKVWEEKGKEGINSKYEIMISAEYLNRTPEEIVSTLLHEMVHLYNKINNIEDTSNNSVYHNKKFKLEAEKRGLIIEHAKTIGWSVTTLQDSTKELLKTFKINNNVFDYYRNKFTPLKIKSPLLNKYKCPGCETKLTSRKEVNLICGDCNKKFELVNALELVEK